MSKNSLVSSAASMVAATAEEEEGEFSMGAPHHSSFDSPQPNTWSEPPATNFLVRGPNYLKQSKRNAVDFKQASGESIYKCINLNVFVSPVSLEHCSMKIGEFRRFLAEQQDEEEQGLPLFVTVCFMFRSLFSADYTLVQHVFKRQGRSSGQDAVLERTMRRFLQGDDAYRNERFKFMLHIIKAPRTMLTTVRSLGGERPVLIGKRLTTQYFRGPNYLEVDMDVSSSVIASALNSTINSASKQSILDYAWLIQAEEEDELPERVLVKLRAHFCDPPALFVHLDYNGERKQV